MWKWRVSGNSRSIFVIIFVLFFSLPSMAQYSGGTGEPNNPYKIATAEDLIALGNEPNDYNDCFIMTADIDLSGYVFDKAVIAQIDDILFDASFTGVFDGNEHAISNLNIQSNNRYTGLFGSTKNAKIINLGLIDITISGKYVVGGLAGQANSSIISNCYVIGSINGNDNTGGLIGIKSSGSVNQCYSKGTVKGSSMVGGLIGAQYGFLIHCYSDTTVTGGIMVGGLVGENMSGDIVQCYSIGSVTGNYVGGLVGNNFMGYVNHCYSTGAVNNNSIYKGGMIGHNESGKIINSFWDRGTSGQNTSAGGTGKNTTEMYDPNTFINAGWDFVGESQNGTTQVWQIPEGGGYPELTFFNDYEPQKLNGTGTQNDPYLISDANELGAICHYDSNANFKLSNSIDLSGITWGTAIIPYFEGCLDGNNKTISNMAIEGSGFSGLLGVISSKSKVNNLGLVNVNINCSGKFTGALAGHNYGTITQCYSTGEIIGDESIGGIAGYNQGNIDNSYSHVIIDGNNYKGGFLGTNTYEGTVVNCYSAGKASNTSGQGVGLIGNPQSMEIYNCFWDIEVSGCENICRIFYRAGTDKTTAQMQTKSTFTNAGWDFVGEINNGLEDIWTICEGTNYPRFTWQIAAGDAVCPDGITLDDFEYFLNHWNESNCNSENGFCEGTDLDFSGVVDINDFEILMNNWLEEN